ncbi:hypothetical protein GJ496_006952 [Pomphorhynchus laevis]|nr:hypothetical protein GJ496_006952 [Pomphorhynchus laevis]
MVVRYLEGQIDTYNSNKLWLSLPKKYGKGSRHCRVCSTHSAIIRKYGLYVCRRCFRENAECLGFSKHD